MKRRSGLTGADNVGTKRAKKQRDDAQQQAGFAAAPPDSAFNAKSAGANHIRRPSLKNRNEINVFNEVTMHLSPMQCWDPLSVWRYTCAKSHLVSLRVHVRYADTFRKSTLNRRWRHLPIVCAGTAREMSSSMQICRTPTKTMDAFVSQRSSVSCCSPSPAFGVLSFYDSLAQLPRRLTDWKPGATAVG